MRKFLRKILKRLARLTVWKYNPEVIGVTGSVGKTSAKEAIFAVLANRSRSALIEREKWQIRKSEGNLNNELGVPLVILGDWGKRDLNLVSRSQPAGTRKAAKAFFWLKVILIGAWETVFHSSRYPKILVLEYGADRPGDLKYLLKIVRPKIGVVTAVGETPVHIEFYENAEEVAKEKSKLIENLPAGGYAILNYDDDLVLNMKNKTRAQILTFGFDENANIIISNFENRMEEKRPEGVFFQKFGNFN